MTVAAPAEWLVEPFSTHAPEPLSRVRDLFQRLGYTEQGICAGAGIERIYSLQLAETRPKGFLQADDAQSLLVQLFLDAARVPRAVFDRYLSAEDRRVLTEAGLVVPTPADPTTMSATVAVYPIEGLYVASDRLRDIAAFAGRPPADMVYSALTPEAQRFVELMPRTACVDYLELCSGTGIAALLAASTFAQHAAAVDLTERSTRFAEFNAALNGISNFSALCGDLYAPVAGRTFDMISAHPPYVPALANEMIYRDGGQDGEQVTRAILEGLFDHLRPGGQLYCDCMMTDRTGAPMENRIREMLGPGQNEFDVLIGQMRTLPAAELFTQAIIGGRMDRETNARHVEAFAGMGIEQFVQAAFIVRRRASIRPVTTRRRIVSPRTVADDFQWYLEMSVVADASSSDDERYLNARVRTVPGIQVQSRAAFENGSWRTLNMSLTTLSPFAAEAECAHWFGALLARCDGSKTAREHLAHFRAAGAVSAAGSERDFAGLIRQMADACFIELDFLPARVR